MKFYANDQSMYFKRSFDFDDFHVCRVKVQSYTPVFDKMDAFSDFTNARGKSCHALMAQLFIFVSTALKGDIQIKQSIMVKLGCE